MLITVFRSQGDSSALRKQNSCHSAVCCASPSPRTKPTQLLKCVLFTSLAYISVLKICNINLNKVLLWEKSSTPAALLK